MMASSELLRSCARARSLMLTSAGTLGAASILAPCSRLKIPPHAPRCNEIRRSLSQILQEVLGRALVKARENLGHIFVAQVSVDGFAEHLAKFGGNGQVAAFVEMLLLQSGPAAVHFAALDRAAQNKHDVGMTMVGAAVAVLARCASEFRHGDDHGVSGQIAEVGPERGNGL